METEPTPPSQLLLPQELIDTLIDWIQDLRQDSSVPQDFTSTLKACSLTCKAFLPQAQKHLFRELILRTNPRDHYRATDKFRQRVQPLLDRDHLTGLSPELLSHVRKLTVCEGHLTQTDWHVNGERHWLLPFGLLPFTALTEIELGSKNARSSYDSEIDGQSLSMLLRNNSSLETLHLDSVTFRKRSEMLSVLSSLSQHVNFHNLGLISVHIQDALLGIDMPVISCVQRPRLKKLDFRDPDDRLLGVLFLNPDSIFDISGLQTLDLSTQLKPIMSQTAPEDGNYPKILSRCPGSLTRLCLDVRDFLWMGVTAMDYLQDATELELLELKGLSICHGWTRQIEFIVTLISALPSKLHCLSLHADIQDVHLFAPFMQLDWKLSTTLPLSDLKEVRIVFKPCGDSGEWETDIERIVNWFPLSRKRGLLITPERSKRRDLRLVK
ncbi:hypothetical protein K435DRAFT_964186 [Dendrothele bispora CBS 962.96]|uniref:F-box domain-containing protein n=1 Tax=Dendrothele bispora (strain CBS 962.96) TaxID=1314807 RepID=A0A4S8MCU9_DENBC|nr:hypothetical protein K435DRAFT_964186 [Dendrothele bispora CBS 962.96]